MPAKFQEDDVRVSVEPRDDGMQVFIGEVTFPDGTVRRHGVCIPTEFGEPVADVKAVLTRWFNLCLFHDHELIEF